MKKSFLPLLITSLLLAFPFSYGVSQCLPTQHKVKVSLEINGAWTELGWDMFDIQGNPVMSRPNMPTNSSNQWVYDSVCVDAGTVLKFRIFDGKGQGLCCEFGDGYYSVEVDGQPILIGGPFWREEESFTFQVDAPQTDLNLREIYLNDTLASYVHWVRGRVHNTGKTAIQSFDMNWKIEGEGVRTHSFSGLNIQPGEEYKWTHPFGWDANTMGDFQLKSWISNVNLNADLLTANDSLSQNIHIYKPKRNVLAEYITNFYCGPCARWMVNIKEQVNMSQSFAFALGLHSDGWSGRDILYQASPVDMQGRIDLYNTNSHPNARLMGQVPGSYPAKHITQSRLQESSRTASPFDISVPQLTLTGNQLSYTADISTPMPFAGNNLRVHVAIVERHIYFASPQPNGETASDWVLRKMLPDFNGANLPSAWTAGQVYPVQGTHTVTNAIDLENLGVLVFVQDMNTKDVYNVNYAPVKGPDTTVPNNTSIDNPSALKQIKVYPNPAREAIFVEMELAQTSDLQVVLTNVQGQKLRQVGRQQAAMQEAYRLDVENLATGLYILMIYSDGKLAHSQKVWVK